MASKDGGPAFPVSRYNGPGNYSCATDGMSLRDYFASHAPWMPASYLALWGDRERNRARTDSRYCVRSEIFALIDFAWEYADAMIAERGK